MFIYQQFKETSQINEIMKVDLKGNIIKIWEVEDNWGFMSVTTESNVLLTVSGRNKLCEYSPDGQPLREIHLSASIIHPFHAIKLTSDLYVVSHGHLGDPLHRVCTVDSNGNVIKSFGGESGSTKKQMNVPAYLAVNSDGSILVVDRLNGRVLLLSADLEFRKEILSEKKDKLRSPFRIHLDQSHDRLFLADRNFRLTNGHVLIFSGCNL